MPLILAAANHPTGMFILRTLPVYGVIPPTLLSFSPDRPAPDHDGTATSFPLGFLISGLRAALSYLGVELSHLTSLFDGHLHLPAIVQDALAEVTMGMVGYGDYLRLESAIANRLLGWLSHHERQIAAVTADPPPHPSL